MILPRYYFEGDFQQFEDLIENCKLESVEIKKGIELKYLSQRKSIYIKNGMVKLSICNEEGNESVVMFAGKGIIYPVTCLEEQFTIEQFMSLKTVLDTEIIVFPKEKILELIHINSEFAVAAINFNSKTINSLLTKNILGGYENSEQSVCSFLYSYIIYNPNNNNNNIVDFTQEEIASVVGISRMQVTRILGSLRAKGIVKTIRGKVIVLEIEMLKDNCASIIKEV